tara:strand:+ start:3022 stop:3690 length:669 start_codon:yes stop_codon:yes gene_type:complete
MVDGENGGLVCNDKLYCADGFYKCLWGAGHGGTNAPLDCCGQTEYCDGETNIVYGGDLGFVGSFVSTNYIGCHGAGGCVNTDQITKIGVWVTIQVAGCSTCGGATCRGRKTVIKIYLAPFLNVFDCYTNFADATSGGAGDYWFFYGVSSCIEGCGCAAICEEIICEAGVTDVWMIPSDHQARNCVPCSEPNVQAVYRAAGSAIGDATVTITDVETPCGFFWS